MKINILEEPPVDIFMNRRKYTLIFIALLALACCGLFLGGYAIVADTSYYNYNQLETISLFLFAAPSPFVFYVGEKLQGYKKLTPPQYEELADFAQMYQEVKVYCEQVAKANREPIRAEYEACQDWAEARREGPTTRPSTG